ncbi:hypothetical protein [Streptomyces thermodiastaticus]|uniref:hypothetical protein n=1 Tax=Streptomyces thermodiastaticus TaxID=44061 RepID=UPI001678DE1E|nr:hypothetical protein [Streptomyces thermodiastaticus]MCE7549165.1 hypothetical protein [Streptomyces thermodiastaticus]GHF60639.1 hypothetical protein GCM10018787_06010 [Streptomyces thermodiastaticus]
MVFQLLPQTEPLELRGGAVGPLVPFTVPIEATGMFLRVIALWRDNLPLVGRAPTFELKSGCDGRLTAVDAGRGKIEIPGADGEIAALAEVDRLPGDSYLIALAGLEERTGPWHLRITNNDAETLRFTCVASYSEEMTRQPWMALECATAVHDGLLALHSDTPETAIKVRNLGTAPLIINDPPGSRLGSDGSPVVLLRRPAPIAPHHADELVVECGQVHYTDRFSHTFDTNDVHRPHTTLLFEVLPRSLRYDMHEEWAFCRACGRCPDYVAPPVGVGGPCAACGHRAAHHSDVPPDHRNV